MRWNRLYFEVKSLFDLYNYNKYIIWFIKGLNWWESSEDLNTLYLGLGGLAYGAEYREASVRTLRNPFNDLYGFIKQDRKRHSIYILGQWALNFSYVVVLGLNRTGRMSFLTGWDLSDQTKSRLLFLNILHTK